MYIKQANTRTQNVQLPENHSAITVLVSFVTVFRDATRSSPKGKRHIPKDGCEGDYRRTSSLFKVAFGYIFGETLNAVLKERRRLKTGWPQTKPSSSDGHHGSGTTTQTLLIHRQVSLSLCYPARNCISELPNQCESKVRILM